MAKATNKTRRLTPHLTSLIVAVGTFVVLFGMISMSVAPQRYDLKVGEVSKITITATKDVTDTVTTQRLIDEAVRAVSPSYNTDETVMPMVMEQLDSSLSNIVALPGLREGLDGSFSGEATASMIEQAHQKVHQGVMTDDMLRRIIEANEADLKELADDISAKVRDLLNSKLLEGQEREAVEKIRRDLSETYDERLATAVLAAVRDYIRPNMLLDEETTGINREKAEQEVEPVIYKKGQNIVRMGEVVTAPQIQMLDSLGMLKDRAVDMSLYVGIGLLLLLLALVIGVYLYTFEQDMVNEPGKLVLLCLICVIVIGFSIMVRPISTYLMPVVLGAMLTTQLLKSRLAIVTNLVLSVLTGLLASVDSGMFTSTMFSIIITSFVAGTVCVVIIRGRLQRLQVLLSGVIGGIVGLFCTLAVSLINSANLQNIVHWAGFAAGSGLLSAVLCIGIQPALEWIFNLDTGAKLMDLSNPNQQLLRRLMIEAPGTYHHSMIVANMSEAAANAIGANGLLARVGSYYHDIGKLKRPLYFKENQMTDNPHDRTDPRVSTAILNSHTRDGVEMAQKVRLPQAVQDIILMHHGDTPVLFFYDKAVKQGGNIDISDFRYDGPRPEKQEAAIVMLADTIEAAARSMTDSTPEKLSALIQRLVRSKMEDGQLDRCSLTFRDLNLICDAFLTVLGGVFHERIEYPEVKVPERNRLEELPPEPEKQPLKEHDKEPARGQPVEPPGSIKDQGAATDV